MKTKHTALPFACGAAYLFIFLCSGRIATGATVWTGPNVTWTKSPATPSDSILPGKVVLKRNGSGVLYNTAAGESGPGSASPKGITFAFGDIKDFATLNYKSLATIRAGSRPNFSAAVVNRPMVAHIVADDIYFSITVTDWGRFGSGDVSYVRSSSVVAVPPTVTLTSPTEGSTFTAPATVNLSATASGGTITGVSFFTGGTLLGSVPTAPYEFTVNGLGAGAYAFTAVATTADTSATSGVVHITVTAPLTDISLNAPAMSNGNFTFTYTTDPGQTYIVQSATTLGTSSDWAPVSTNVASRSFVNFSDPAVTTGARFFRVERVLP